jgi:hypothetical protein
MEGTDRGAPGSRVGTWSLEVFVEIEHYAGGNERVINTLLTALTSVMETTKLQERQDLLVVITATLAGLSTSHTGLIVE